MKTTFEKNAKRENMVADFIKADRMSHDLYDVVQALQNLSTGEIWGGRLTDHVAGIGENLGKIAKSLEKIAEKM